MFYIRNMQRGNAPKQTWANRLPGRSGTQVELERYLELVRQRKMRNTFKVEGML